jgi:hypothetical protein
MTEQRGRPPHEPTAAIRKQVDALKGYGVTEFDIARVIGISVPTLLKYYREEIETAAIRANARVAQSLFHMATHGNVAAAIFWLKTQARWSEPPKEFIQVGDPTKKELAVEAARTAGDGTRWGELLQSERPN